MKQGIKYRLEKLKGFIQNSIIFRDIQPPHCLAGPKVLIRGEELSCASWGVWDVMEEAFKGHPPILLEQWWEETTDSDFEAGFVRIGWKGDKIYLLIDMEDCSITTAAQENGERLWELGDTIEIFIKAHAAAEYYEFQVAPNGCILQLKYPDAQTIGTLRGSHMKGWEQFVVREPLFAHDLKIAENRWSALIEIPAQLLFPECASLSGCSCQVSVSRYDYWADGRPPCLSSTSPHFQLDFHQQKDWAWVKFVPMRENPAAVESP